MVSSSYNTLRLYNKYSLGNCDFITERLLFFGYIKVTNKAEQKHQKGLNGGFMYAVFKNNLLTGNELIDEQHKELINRINKLVGACENGVCQLEAIRMLDFLSDYTDFHFREEEELQEKAEYPGLEEHKARHEEFRKSVEELHEMLVEEEGPSERFVKAVQDNVVDWLYRHIKGFDCSVAAYIQLKHLPERL